MLAAGSRHTQSEVAAPHHRMEAGVYVDGVAVVLVVLLTSTSCQTPLLEAMCFASEVHWTWKVGVNYEVKRFWVLEDLLLDLPWEGGPFWLKLLGG